VAVASRCFSAERGVAREDCVEGQPGWLSDGTS
jgi:hypothetical protein